jgi:hypothetical protein
MMAIFQWTITPPNALSDETTGPSSAAIMGGKTAAVLRSFIPSCELVKIDSFVSLCDVISRIADHPVIKLDELLLHNWATPQRKDVAVDGRKLTSFTGCLHTGCLRLTTPVWWESLIKNHHHTAGEALFHAYRIRVHDYCSYAGMDARFFG